MNLKDIERRQAGIKRVAWDPEAAHTIEDKLWCDVLTAISEGAENPKELAAKALESLNIEFPRWCA